MRVAIDPPNTRSLYRALRRAAHKRARNKAGCVRRRSTVLGGTAVLLLNFVSVLLAAAAAFWYAAYGVLMR